jgi:hypothetical protein
MSKQLLVDYMPFDVSPQQINESLEQNGGMLVVTGPLQAAEKKNQNGRIYPKAVLEREAENYSAANIAERRALGELDHPESSVVNLQNVSHNVRKIWWEGLNLMGEVEVLSTPSGNILKELFKNGIKLGISSRGLGSVKELREQDGEETVEVQDDFELICWDFVSNPSTQGAFMAPLMESAGRKAIVNPYGKINNLITEILCDMTGKCNISKQSCSCSGTCGCGGH